MLHLLPKILQPSGFSCKIVENMRPGSMNGTERLSLTLNFSILRCPLALRFKLLRWNYVKLVQI
jgi:hypothetical protein